MLSLITLDKFAFNSAFSEVSESNFLNIGYVVVDRVNNILLITL